MLTRQSLLRVVTKQQHYQQNALLLGISRAYSQKVSLFHSNKRWISMYNAKEAHGNVLPNPSLNTKKQGISLSVAAFLAAGCFVGWLVERRRNIKYTLDASGEGIEIDAGISPYPTSINAREGMLGTTYTLLGCGVRYISVATFRLYALGIYVASNETSKIVNSLRETMKKNPEVYPVDANLKEYEIVENYLKDPSKNVLLIDNLMNTQIKLLAKLTPLRNTDFTHFRKGIVKAVNKHPEASKHREEIDKGFEEVDQVFTRKGTLAKDDDLYLELKPNGSMEISTLRRKNDSYEKICTIQNPIIGKLMFSQYMCGPNAPSQMAKDAVAASIVDLFKDEKAN
ncbi:hypothetical protein TBLA_0A10640 [Henningerozyma blattae CBS 6284]|uniref:Altered inheritance of mitochondria protein 18, mitochondrial n=1 Tax=Henningerozyma blattae (strain ATCC 34711 / CBS 6284 / DSM 70876 / NBRC 10599 / NRRL Y-10934 / UCD 77-7) TaxID=1071380 RepID=I2GXJ0_HENB6|nr:hypothetical protein TBLA_0A10640 [Tetrapisispora blattae CBS 6284]CCH58842.1 hypothetical protein TBLA_0A10640 [Tetrapisispora blattae CBS 6284]